MECFSFYFVILKGLFLYHLGLGVYYFIVYCEWVHQVMGGKGPRYEIQWVGPLCYLRPAKGQLKTN